MDEVGEDGKFIALFDVVRGPIIGKLIAGFLPGHALLNPFGAAALFLPGVAGAGKRTGGIGHFLHPLIANPGKPEFDGFGLGAGHALDEAQQGLGGGRVSEALFAILRRHFQLVTIRHQLTAFLAQPLFQLVPIFSGGSKIRLLGQHADDVHDGKPPRFGRLVVMAADFVAFKNGEVVFHRVNPPIIWAGCHIQIVCSRRVGDRRRTKAGLQSQE